MNRYPMKRLGWLLVFAMVVSLVSLGPPVAITIRDRNVPPSWQRGDVDTQLIQEGLRQAPRFVDTLRWWTGTWVGQVPYYRPLTSYAFWLQWKAFGDAEWLYLFPSLLFHAVAACLFVLFAYCLASQHRDARYRLAWPAATAALAAVTYNGFLADFRLPVIAHVALFWKNQPDSLAIIGCFASLICYLRAPTTRWGLPAAIGWYLAGCGFKEIAIPLPVVCLALEWLWLPQQYWKPALLRVGGMAAAGILFLVVRSVAIGGVGYLFGSNQSWFSRTLMHALGPFSGLLQVEGWVGTVGGLWVCGVTALYWRKKIRMAAAVLLIPFGWATLGISQGIVMGDVSPTAFLDPAGWAFGLVLTFRLDPMWQALSTIVAVGILLLLWRHHRPALGLGMVWTAAFLAPLAVSPGPIHRYYVPQCGYILMTVLALGAAGGLSYLRRQPSPLEDPLPT